MTDRELYNTSDAKTYVIQFETADHQWQDSLVPVFWSFEAALEYLRKMKATPYPYRIVERTK